MAMMLNEHDRCGRYSSKSFTFLEEILCRPLVDRRSANEGGAICWGRARGGAGRELFVVIRPQSRRFDGLQYG
jgi:hypothetical protein